MLGRYDVGPAIGRGATAVVHRGLDRATGEEVAVKVVPVELGIDERVDIEARAAGRLDHPGIVALRDAGRDAECLYLISDLVDGPSLAAALRAPEPPGDAALIRIGAEVLDALAHAHERGVAHRDVKPANILLSSDGRARLADFGVARLADQTAITMTGSLVGTMAYMAPEQARGERAGPPADVYAACLVLYQGLVGENPLHSSSPAETARRAAAGVPGSLGDRRPDLPAAVIRAVDAGLHPDPSSRPHAASLADALAGAGGGLMAVRRRGRRHLAAAASAIGAAGVVGALVAAARDDLGLPGPGATVAAMAAAAVLAAFTPRLAAVAAAGVAIAGAATVGPGLAILVAILAGLLMATGAAHGRLLLAPLAAPALFAIGLGPLYAALCGLAPRWGARVWAAVAGMVATLAWQLARGADGLLAGGPFAPAGGDDLGSTSPIVLGRALWEPVGAHPLVLGQIAVVALAAAVAPAVLRAPQGGARIALAALWLAGLGAGLAACVADPPAALGATLPAAIVVGVWAVWPWRSPAGRVPSKAFATLRGSA